MAIISIPTSIGGVSIPGALVNGPLGALFGNKYGKEILQYPRDLNSATRGHMVQFAINETQPISYDSASNPVADATGFIGTADSVIKNISSSFNLGLTPKRTRNVGVISLYIPDTINFTYNSGYSGQTLLETIGEAGGALTSLATSGKETGLKNKIKGMSKLASTATSKTAKLGLATQGLAINPHEQLLFDGITFRTYQMMFTFTPYSADEAAAVAKIINTFKKHAAPRITTKAEGMFFVVPSTFNIKFFFNGAENKNVNRVAESVIESIDVNYSPNGWSTTEDGAPVQTVLTISFKEIELIDRTKIEDGY